MCLGKGGALGGVFFFNLLSLNLLLTSAPSFLPRKKSVSFFTAYLGIYTTHLIVNKLQFAGHQARNVMQTTSLGGVCSSQQHSWAPGGDMGPGSSSSQHVPSMHDYPRRGVMNQTSYAGGEAAVRYTIDLLNFTFCTLKV